MNRTRVRRGTERCARFTVPAVLGVLGIVLTALVSLSGLAEAAPVELNAKVVWLRGDRVYVASAESLTVEVGDILRFRVGGKEIATGTAVDVRDEAMIVASLTSGSFRKQKKLDKIRVLAEQPPLVRLPMLRIGCPSPTRPSLLFACERGTIGGSLPPGLYRADTLSQRSYRFVRDSTVALAEPWPDTLLIRAFDESADEEIALERGELDVAVFWPGELSTHVREDLRWREHIYGIRSRGVLFAMGSVAAGDVRGAIGALNEATFRGDLSPSVGHEGSGAVDDATVAQRPATDLRLEIDSSIRAYATIERALQQSQPSHPPSQRRRLRVGYSGVEVREGKAVFPMDTATSLSLVRCPVVSSLKLRRMITALGPNRFADLIDCGTPGR